MAEWGKPTNYQFSNPDVKRRWEAGEITYHEALREDKENPYPHAKDWEGDGEFRPQPRVGAPVETPPEDDTWTSILKTFKVKKDKAPKATQAPDPKARPKIAVEGDEKDPATRAGMQSLDDSWQTSEDDPKGFDQVANEAAKTALTTQQPTPPTKPAPAKPSTLGGVSVKVAQSVKGAGSAGAPVKLPTTQELQVDYAEPTFEEKAVEFELPDGRKATATPTQMQAILATEKAKEVGRLLDEYRKEDDSARSAAVWAEVIRGVAALAIAQYGLKHGADMSGFQLQPIDWTAQQRERRAAVDTKTAATKDVYGTYEAAAKAAGEGQQEAFKALQDSAWKKTQTQLANKTAILQQAELALRQQANQNEVWAKRMELLARRQEAMTKSGKDLTASEEFLLQEIKALDLKYFDALEKGNEDQIKALDTARRLPRAKLSRTRPDLAGTPAELDAPADEGFLTKFFNEIVNAVTGNSGPAKPAPAK